MSIGVSGGPEYLLYESAIHLRKRRFSLRAVQAVASSEVASGRPAATDAA